MEESAYSILEVSKDASELDIKAAYRKLTLKYHPDRNSGSMESEEHFKRVSEAYGVLINKEARAKYDAELHTAKKANPVFNTTTIVDLTLEQVAHGGYVKVDYLRAMVCPVCHNKEKIRPDCGRCHASGVVRTKYSIEPMIPPGSKAGDQFQYCFRCPEKGDIDIKNMAYADLLITFRYIPHDVFRILPDTQNRDMDLEMTIPINLPQLMLTGVVRVKTLYKEIAVKLTGKELGAGRAKISNHGLPDWDNTTKGCLILKFLISFPAPSELTNREKKLLEYLVDCKNFKTPELLP